MAGWTSHLLLVIVLGAEVLSNNKCSPAPAPTVDLSDCLSVCDAAGLGTGVKRFTPYECECAEPGR